MTGTSTTADLAPDVDLEEGLRELRAKDWILGAASGLVLSMSLWVVGLWHVPEHMRLTVTVLGFGMGLLAYLDHVTHLIRNRHTLILGFLIAATLQVPFMTSGVNPWLPALISAAAVFIFMLVIASTTGLVGGGDIKLAPVIGAALAPISPIAVSLWLTITFISCMIFMIVAKLRRSEARHAAMAPHMAIALIPALIVTSIVLNKAGLT